MEPSTIINILFYLLIGWFLYILVAPIKGLKNLGAHEFKMQLEQSSNRMLIDVRQPGEYKSGHIAEAKNIPLSQIKKRLGEIPTDREIFVYCRSGARSKQAARILSKKGFRNISNLHGGILSWNGNIDK